jgi:chromosome segregation ATPase
MDLGHMQTIMNVAIVEYAINKLKECLEAELDPERTPGQRQAVRYQAVTALDRTAKFLRGDVLLTDLNSAKEALALEAKYNNTVKKIMKLEQERAELQEKLDGFEGEEEALEPEPVFVCDGCKREFSTKRGLSMHAKACKG